MLDPDAVGVVTDRREEISDTAEQMASELKLEKWQVPVLQVGWMCGIEGRDGG